MSANVIDRGTRGGGGTRRRHSRTKPMAEINVTPFVDVMLVLLITFMVAAPLLTVGVPVNLPETAATPLPQEQDDPLTVSISADGTVVVQETEVPREQLVQMMTEVFAQTQDEKIFLRADAGLPYGDMMVVMGALNAAGYRNIGLVTDGGGPTLDGEGEQ